MVSVDNRLEWHEASIPCPGFSLLIYNKRFGSFAILGLSQPLQTASQVPPTSFRYLGPVLPTLLILVLLPPPYPPVLLGCFPTHQWVGRYAGACLWSKMSLSSSEARSSRQYHVGRALWGGERISYRFFVLGPLGWLADPLYCQDTREDIRSVSLARPWFPGRQKTVSLGSR